MFNVHSSKKECAYLGGTHFMALRFFTSFHNGTCGLNNGYKNEGSNASEHGVESDFGELEVLCDATGC